MLSRFYLTRRNDFSKHCSPCHSASENRCLIDREFFWGVKYPSSTLWRRTGGLKCCTDKKFHTEPLSTSSSPIFQMAATPLFLRMKNVPVECKWNLCLHCTIFWWLIIVPFHYLEVQNVMKMEMKLQFTLVIAIKSSR